MSFFAADAKTKAVYNQLLSGNAWKDVWGAQLADLQTSIALAAAWLGDQYPQYATVLLGLIAPAGSVIKLKDHLASQSADLTTNLSLAISYNSELQAMGHSVQIDAIVQNLFGSVMGQASLLLAAATSQTQAIQAQFSPSGIQTAVANLSATMLQISALVDAEKQAKADVLATLSMTTDAYTLPSLYEDVLAKQVLDVLASDSMLTVLEMSDDDEGAEHDDPVASPGNPDPPAPILVAPNIPVIQQIPDYGVSAAGEPWRLNIKLASAYMTVPAFSENANAVAGTGGSNSPPPVVIQTLPDL